MVFSQSLVYCGHCYDERDRHEVIFTEDFHIVKNLLGKMMFDTKSVLLSKCNKL